jgi:hypothetical protein
MGAASNAGCVNCHPDNRNDRYSQGRADDGTSKAYPHASDGTNVVGDNSNLLANISAVRASGTGDTCAKSCHPRSASITWGSTGNCDMCHYYSATPSSATNTGTGALGGSHSAHFDECNLRSCHVVPDTATQPMLRASGGPPTRRYCRPHFTGGTCSSTRSCHGASSVTRHGVRQASAARPATTILA